MEKDELEELELKNDSSEKVKLKKELHKDLYKEVTETILDEEIEIQKLELKKVELELELKKLELEKQKQEHLTQKVEILIEENLETKPEIIEPVTVEPKTASNVKVSLLKETVEVDEKEVVGIKKNNVKETRQVTTEKATNVKITKQVDKDKNKSKTKTTTKKSKGRKMDKKLLKKELYVLFIVFYIIFCAIVIDHIKYYKSIPLILNPEEYYMMTKQDIVDRFGKYDGKSQTGTGVTYEMKDYELSFGFDHGYVSRITYTPNEPFKYRYSSNEAFRLFGLEDKKDLFEKEGSFDSISRFFAKSNYYVYAFVIDDIDIDKNTVGDVSVSFKENYPEIEVFEDDFSDIEVVYNLAQFVSKDKDYVTRYMGNYMELKDGDTWVYYTDLGRIEFWFPQDSETVKFVNFFANEPMKYEDSTQEILVMFGINPLYNGFYLETYDYRQNYYIEGREPENITGYESYNNMNGGVGSVCIYGLDVEKKTFKHVHFGESVVELITL